MTKRAILRVIAECVAEWVWTILVIGGAWLICRAFYRWAVASRMSM